MEVAEETAAHRQSTQAHHSTAERGAEERRRGQGELLRLSVHPGGLEFGVDDLLLVVQAVIAGQHVADGTSYGEQKYSVRSEQLYAQEQRCKRTVYHATEEAHHS